MKVNFKETLKAIRAAFEAAPVQVAATPAPAALEAKEYTLADGVTKVTISKLEVGGVITPTPTEAGSITLDNQTVISYDAAGVITSVTPAKETAPAPVAPMESAAAPVVMSREDMKEFLSKFTADEKFGVNNIDKLATIVKALFESVFGWEIRRAQEEVAKAEAMQIYQEGFNKHNKAVLELITVVETIANAGVEEPKETPEKDWQSMTSLEQFRAAKNVVGI